MRELEITVEILFPLFLLPGPGMGPPPDRMDERAAHPGKPTS